MAKGNQDDPIFYALSPDVQGGYYEVKQVSGAVDSVSVINTITVTPFATYYASDAVGSVYITGSAASTYAELLNPDGRVKVELPSGASSLTDTELRASHIDVVQMSGTVDSVSVLSMPAVTVTSITNSAQSALIDSTGVQYSGSNPFPITGNIGTITTVTGVTNSIATSILNGDGVALDPRNRNWTITETVPISSSSTLDVKQVSDASWSTNVLSMPAVTVTSITNSSAVVNLDRDGNPWSPYTFGQGDLATALRTIQAGDSVSSVIVNSGTITTVTTLTGITNTIATANVDSTGVQYSGSNPMPVDDMGVVMTTNPTKVADGGVIAVKTDAIGRQITTPIQVRGLMQTAYVSISTGTETTLLAGVSGVFMDLVSISASTDSTFATTAVVPPYIGVRDCRTGGVLFSFPVSGLSATNTGSQTIFTKDFSVPLPQNEAGNAWTVDMNDITGTTVNIQALFARNT